mmetsp:Transcript_8930/g.10240  ORF Transcript_8930/g.10240 Transcript_8930/m.10240 type:complete len:89 (+) Transcript_8930:323-589(+)
MKTSLCGKLLRRLRINCLRLKVRAILTTIIVITVSSEEIEQLRARFLAQSTGTRKGMDQLQNKMHITASKGSKVRIEQEQYFASKIPM